MAIQAWGRPFVPTVPGQPIGTYDLLIAGQARARNLVLVTANSREFERVEDLICEDWTLSGADP